MNLRGIPSPLIQKDDNIVDVFLGAYHDTIMEGDILIVTSKVISVSEGSVVPCTSRNNFLSIISQEADEVIGRSKKYDMYLTKRKGIVLPNAGIDCSNAEPGTAIVLPRNPESTAREIRKGIQEKTGVKNFGVIICDSCVFPFRRGISSIALAWSGFLGISDERGKRDIYGQELKVSEIAVADNLSSVAQIYFGQADEKVPFVLVQDAPVSFTDEKQDCTYAHISPEEDLFGECLRQDTRGLL